MNPTIIHPDNQTSASDSPIQPAPVVTNPVVESAPASMPISIMSAATTSSVTPEQPAQQPIMATPMSSMQPVQIKATTQGLLMASQGTKSKFVGLKLAVALLILVALAAGGYFANHQVNAISRANATNAANNFVGALGNGNNAAAYDMTDASLHAKQSQVQFSNALGDLSTTGTPTLNDASTNFGYSSATIYVNESGLAPDADGSTVGTFAVSLVKDGLVGWKVDSVSVQ